jgi:23S rRNA (uracil1939-C5)-methyltransferase
MTSDLETVTLEKLVYGGDTLARLADGRAVFIPHGLPGEKVRIQAFDEKRDHVRAELVEVVTPSALRIDPKCGHFSICGGCHYQHLPYPVQLETKAEILKDQLGHISRIKDPPVIEITPSTEEWNYRNHMQFHLTGEGRPGFVDFKSRGVFAVEECHLPEPALNSLWPSLEFEPDTGVERVSLRVGEENEILLILDSDNLEMPMVELEAGISMVHQAGEDVVVLAGNDHLTMKVNDRTFHVSAGSFFQVNTRMAGKMVDHLLNTLQVSPATTLLDVFCGVGLFSAFFARRVGKVIAIESSASACEDFVTNLDEFDNVSLYQASAEQVLPSLQEKPEVVIVDPPRRGLQKRSLEALVALAAQQIAYASCDPSTLARDASRLIAGGYRLADVRLFDLFPQTFHIESISIFEKG